MLMRNVGPPWRRYRSNELVPHGGTFEATRADVERFQRRMEWGILFVPVTAASTVEAPAPAAAVPDTPAQTDWPLKITPADYLARHPNGPKAALARQVLEGRAV